MKRHLQYHWWKYLVAVLLPILVWSTVFDAVSKPKKNECLRVLFIGETLDETRLQDDLSEHLSQMTDCELKQITVKQMLPDALALGEILTARQFDYDIIILRADECEMSVGQNFFSPLSEKLLTRFEAGAPYYEAVEDRSLPYGLILSGKTRFSSYLTEGADCVLFFSTESVNLGTLNGKGAAEDDAALFAADFLLEEPD